MLQPLPALPQRRVPGEQIHFLQHRLRAHRDQLGPVLLTRRLHRRRHQAEIPPRIVRPDVEPTVAMIGVVLDLVPPRRHQTPRPPRIVGPKKLLLRCRVA